MSWTSQGRGRGDDELDPDAEIGSALRFVDPSSGDPNYWLRFQSWVMRNASPELARRRLMADVTIGDVVSGWARMVVPTAMLAAAVAGLLLVRAPATEAPARVTVEDLLVVGLEDESIPAALADAPGTQVAFAGEVF